jgi:citrate lyase beta subunit
MTADFSTEAAALGTEARHWRRACAALGDLEVGASVAAWKELESYLGESVRKSLTAQTKRLTAQADRVLFALEAAQTPADLAAARAELLTLRRRYTRAEAMVDFYSEAVNTRTNPRIAAVLRGLDTLAVHSMDVVLRPLGIESPPVLTYLDKGMGASILRAGARLWDASLSPAAAIKITRHNLWQPTSLVHETGHQVAHLTGWAPELAAALQAALATHSPLAADAWHSWASEVVADVFAFSLLGYAPVPALATVVDGPARTVFRMPIGDPHPLGMLRVQFNVALCQSWFGAGPWDALGARWLA